LLKYDTAFTLLTVAAKRYLQKLQGLLEKDAEPDRQTRRALFTIEPCGRPSNQPY